MKILLDECITKHLKPLFVEHEVFTVRDMNWGGIKNGKLMEFCTENQFEILLTIDKNLQFQQNLSKYPLTIIILNCATSKIEDLKNFIPPLLLKINNLEKRKAYIFEKNE